MSRPQTFNLYDVVRFEVVDETGRALVRYDLDSVHWSLQDDGTTLKVFLNNKLEELHS